MRAGLGLNGGRLALSVGRLIEGIGIDRVIAGMGAVLEGAPDTVYVVAGTGPYESSLRQQTKALPEVREHVMFVGPVAEAERRSYYNACDVFVMPCREPEEGDTEEIAAAILEATACGKPVVAGRDECAPEEVVDGYNGLLVDPWDVDDVAYGLSMLLIDRDYARRLGENGLRRAREELAWEKVVERIREEIVRVVEIA